MPKETEAKPALRISHIVYGRESDGTRVTYLVDPKGAGDKRAIPEQVVLKRWRRRVFPGFEFDGSRLSATVWRALPALLGPDVSQWGALTVEQLAARRAARPQALVEGFLKPPKAEIMHALFQVCGRSRLAKLVERHAQRKPGQSGVPDLFLFARDLKGRVSIARFVEVKKPKSEERVSQDQLDEIAFMRDLGLHARVLRLDERKLKPARQLLKQAST
jgi:hypothetical protein